jgi:hypothetical protein
VDGEKFLLQGLNFVNSRFGCILVFYFTKDYDDLQNLGEGTEQ